MIVIIVEGGCVRDVYSDEPDEDVKVLDLDNAQSEGTSDQIGHEIEQVERQMHHVL